LGQCHLGQRRITHFRREGFGIAHDNDVFCFRGCCTARADLPATTIISGRSTSRLITNIGFTSNYAFVTFKMRMDGDYYVAFEGVWNPTGSRLLD
jgi:hypothetical protein